jgi:hypothetical protein
VTVQGTGSVLLLFATLSPVPASDDTAEFRFFVNGSETVGSTTSPRGVTFPDTAAAGETFGASICWAITGLSGSSNSFVLQWQQISGAASLNTGAGQHSFQVVEIENDASIIVEQTSSANSAAPATEAALLSQSSVTVAAGIHIFLGNVPMNLIADCAAAFRFGFDGSAISTSARTLCGSDSTASHDASSWCGIHIDDSLAAGTRSFELLWEIAAGAPEREARRQTFQVVQITADATLLADIQTTDAWTVDTTGYENDQGTTPLDTDQTPNSADSVIVTVANASPAQVSGDQAAVWSLGIDDAEVGGEFFAFQDASQQGCHACLFHAASLSAASHSFQLRGRILPTTASMNTHASFQRSLFVLDLETASVGANPKGVFGMPLDGSLRRVVY